MRACPTCDRPVPDHVTDQVTYCSEECYVHGEGMRLCPLCDTYQPGETFQPALRPHPGIRSLVEGLLGLPPPPCVCEECAETCVACGVRQPDVEHLDGEGRCSKCVPLPLGPEVELPGLDAYERQLRAGLDAYEGQL